jgi:PPOX class probable F420-dependent enzyme
MPMSAPSDFAFLRGHRYLSLTTFRKTGKAVATPVWFAGDDRVLYVWTNAQSGKVKRLRNNSTVTVAPCTARGRVLGPEAGATAEILPDATESAETGERLLRLKYRWQWRVGRSMSRLFGRGSVFLRVTSPRSI